MDICTRRSSSHTSAAQASAPAGIAGGGEGSSGPSPSGALIQGSWAQGAMEPLPSTRLAKAVGGRTHDFDNGLFWGGLGQQYGSRLRTGFQNAFVMLGGDVERLAAHCDRGMKKFLERKGVNRKIEPFVSEKVGAFLSRISHFVPLSEDMRALFQHKLFEDAAFKLHPSGNKLLGKAIWQEETNKVLREFALDLLSLLKNCPDLVVEDEGPEAPDWRDLLEFEFFENIASAKGDVDVMLEALGWDKWCSENPDRFGKIDIRWRGRTDSLESIVAAAIRYKSWESDIAEICDLKAFRKIEDLLGKMLYIDLLSVIEMIGVELEPDDRQHDRYVLTDRQRVYAYIDQKAAFYIGLLLPFVSLMNEMQSAPVPRRQGTGPSSVAAGI